MAIRYVLIPKNMNFDSHISISEHMGIGINIRDIQEGIQLLREDRCVRRGDCSDRKSFDFLLKFMVELNLRVFDDDNFEGLYGDSIENLGVMLLWKKRFSSTNFR